MLIARFSRIPVAASLFLVMAAFADQTAWAQLATTDLYGVWRHGDGDIHFKIEPEEKIALWIGGGPPAAPIRTGTWKVLSESDGKSKERKLEFEVIWSAEPDKIHHVVITYHGRDRIEMEFNNEEIRFYNRLPAKNEKSGP